ncbi:metalloregulator ArsR/SmtB family transcription factor [Actinocorallia sp. API 0066]|uniref:ArsR/SmtB family transcription factor n=1 Tax=Actinocorallia sp. API 0066 TaxID=2896846 RepID=UPI001E569849|nr:metalloregulator ArsR/SmtB family transcription factor [Actinocorallia sp. API 0066]MCD0451713.1 metalloregulator ArsR/SmtB family transcription factor [Actinocorallia sp. API 0066]
MTGDAARGTAVRAPLYQVKAELFRALAHPARIRILELLGDRGHSAGELAREIGIEPAHLSQQMAVLRRTNLVVAHKEGTSVHYALADPQLADLLRIARDILTASLAGQADLLADLRATTPPS